MLPFPQATHAFRSERGTAATDVTVNGTLTPCAGSTIVRLMNGHAQIFAFARRLFASVTRWLRPSFLTVEIWDTPGQQADGVICYFAWFDSTMDLRLYDTLTREKQAFKPLDPSSVRMYVCGPTVYGFAHIGNARPVIVFDVLFRFLRHIYGEKHVTYVRNITDVDDKINARAAQDFPGLPINDRSARSPRLPTASFTRTSQPSAACRRPSNPSPPISRRDLR